MKDNFSILKQVQVAAPQALTTSDITGTAADLKGFESARFDVSLASMTGNDSSNYLALKIEESDDNVTFAAVAPAELVGLPVGTTSLTSGIWKSLGSAATAGTLGELGSTVYSIGYVGMKRYVRIVADVTGTLSTTIAIHATLGDAHNGPATAKHSAIVIDA